MRFLISILILISFDCSAQTWYNMGNGLTMGSPCIAQSINSYQGKIIVNGYFETAGTASVNAIAQWDGYQWLPMGLGLWRMDAFLTSGARLIEYNNRLYSTGGFQGAGGSFIGDTPHLANGIARWDGSDWYPLTPGPQPSGINSACYGLQVYHNNLYLGGHFGNAFDSSGTITSKGIARWNDTVFSSVGQLGGNYPPWGYYAALDFCIYNDQLIAGGFFTTIDGMPFGTYNFVAAWNDTTWTTLGTGLNAPVYALTVYNGELYAGGEFTATGDGIPAKHIAKWNGIQWDSVGVGLNDTVMDMCVDTLYNKLYVGGKFTQTGNGSPAKYIAEWNGATWLEVGNGANDYVSCLYSIDSNLYIGGQFTQVGSVPSNHIAVWGNNPVGLDELNFKNKSIRLYPNPNTGSFIVDYKIDEKSSGELIFYDLTGRKLSTYPLSGGTNKMQIDEGKWDCGIYFYQVLLNNEVIESDKFTIVR